MRVDLGDEKGKKVISLTVVRQARHWQPGPPACTHLEIEVDTILATVQCVQCKQRLCPVEWIARLAETWHVVEYHHQRAHEQTARLQEVERRLHAKARCKCQHCGQVTRITWPVVSDSAVRQLMTAANAPPQERAP